MANEKRLINAWDLIEWLNNIDLENYHRHLRGKKSKWLDTNGVRHMIATVPSVDAVEVVRCKDCKHFNHQKALRPGGIWCEYWGTDPDPDDFCSYGERRTDG